MNHHGNKKGDWTACAKVVAGTHQSVLWCFPCHIPASLGQVGCDRPGPPACETLVIVKVVANPSAQGLTHTHTQSLGSLAGIIFISSVGAFAQALSSKVSG